ncbi:unnamed protein product [Aphanomyces euteiches]
MATPEEKFPQEDAAIASANYPSALELYTKAIKTPHMLFGNRSARQNHPKQMLMIKPFQLIQQGRSEKKRAIRGKWCPTVNNMTLKFKKPKYEMKEASGPTGGASNSDRKEAKDRLMSVVYNLVNEKKDQVAHRKAVFGRLEEYKDKFFGPEKESRVSELLQKCIIPTR